ncbi:hypothetical protein ACHQM5_011589 [Ranunculus cassubicifolius]
MFLPGSIMEKTEDLRVRDRDRVGVSDEEWVKFKEIGGLDFGDGIRFEPSKLLEKFQREAIMVNLSSRLVVLADLSVEPMQLMMVSVAVSLMEIGYELQVYSLQDGPVHAVWGGVGVPVTILQNNNTAESAVDWLNFDGVLVNSIETKGIFSCFLQEPFKSLPIIWTIHEREVAIRSRQYVSNGQSQLMEDWRQAFNRATVVVFPNYFLPMMYSAFDSGNYFVIPGSPNQAWEADSFMALEKSSDLRGRLGYGHDDFVIVIVIVGSEFSYSGSWLENAFILQALLPVISDFSFYSLLQFSPQSAIALKLGYPTGTVEHVGIEGDMNSYLSISDLVIYGSFLDEQSFPEVLVQAMCFGKPIIAPDLLIIKKYVDDGINGFLFPKENIGVLTEVLFQAISDGKLSSLAQNVASIGMGPAKNLMVSETIEGYASLLANVLKFPSEARPPKAVADIPPRMKEEWQWHLFDDLVDSKYLNKTLKTYTFIDAIEEQWNSTSGENSVSGKAIDEAFSYTNWEEERLIEMINTRKRREVEKTKRFAVSEALRKMYGIKPDSNSLPPMPLDGNTWSVMHSWTMPTRSFLEFVMFSRMFVDALDAEMYDEHHQSGHCYLSLHKDRHCYSRVLELLVNVWAYHSARRMVYINPENGIMQEQHKLNSRKGQMWIRWFSFATLKSMDEDLAEEFDSDHPTRRWLWLAREQKLRHKQKENRKQKSKDKLSRMRKRVRQKTIGKYVKPLPEDKGVSNSTSTNTTAILR